MACKILLYSANSWNLSGILVIKASDIVNNFWNLSSSIKSKSYGIVKYN